MQLGMTGPSLPFCRHLRCLDTTAVANCNATTISFILASSELSFGLDSSQKVNKKALYPSKFNRKEQGNFILSKKNIYVGYLFKIYTSSSRVSLKALLSSTTTSASDKSNSENGVVVVEGEEMEFNRVNCLVWVLHESAGSFSLVVESLELTRSGTVLAMAWNGKDVHEWHNTLLTEYALMKLKY
ncbi:hypothetical protein Ddye_018465 [Dipteronia dyeriana]|uniref:Uncharacterized protein n=1 Tax=Dipteronia dyeriana TaxID=168575 RepID=A0AAD9UB37_9ROSI|nr:hypothetical protein Ddye_018465 [Dipteronia dyeriana]